MHWLIGVVVLVLCPGFVFLVGVGVLVVVLLDIWRYRDVESWERCLGKLHHIEVRQTSHFNRAPDWHIKCSYSYNVDGKSFTNSRVSVDLEPCRTRDDVVAVERKIELPGPDTDVVAIYHHPAQPQYSVLIRERKKTSLKHVAYITAALLSLGLVMLIFYLLTR
ncbi:MAG: DUF3592 domain-containing protein [Planctomycetota bacterium]